MKSGIFLAVILLFNQLPPGKTGPNIKNELISAIKDFLLVLNQPLRITTSPLLCWKNDEFILLMKTLLENRFLTTPLKGNLSTYWPHEQQMFLVDMGCENAEETLRLANASKLLDYPFKWLIIFPDEATTLISNLNMFVRSKIYVITQINTQNYSITSQYRLGPESMDYITNDIAIWSNNTFLYYNKLTDARNRTDLRKLEVNVSMVVINPETADHLMDTRQKHIEPFTKVNYPLTLHVIEYINATGNIIQWPTWGYKYENTTQYGAMMGDMQNGRAEICATPLFYLDERMPYIDVIAATTPTKAKFIFKAPPLSFIKNVYILPFDTNVWLVCFAFLFVAPIIFYIITYWESNNESFNKMEIANNAVARLKPNISDLWQIQIGAICQQGSEAEPTSISGRIATTFLFVTMLFLYTSYSANIVALLQSTTDSIRTLDDLLTSRIGLGVEDSPWNLFYFKTQPGRVQQAIYKQKVAPPGKPNNFMEIQAGVKKMRNEFFAFHTECSSIYKVVGDTFQEHEKCGLQEIEYLNIFEPYYAIRKNTTYGELFKAALRKMDERGISNRVLRQIYVKKPTCQSQGGNFLSVSLRDCYSAFLVFGIGVGISLFLFLIEKIVHKRQLLNNIGRPEMTYLTSVG